ncbi:MAG: hypothetical protein LBB05_03075 [Puniceicoccales bacterium]|jgi:hypothetical protein|nr:hypothetical protein [Puniceicoccales bacterium]
MVEGLLRDIAISFGFMAIFFGASLLMGTASDKKAGVSCIGKEEVENEKNGDELSMVDH